MAVDRVGEDDLFYQAGSLPKLLALDGIRFVRSAYATVLGREADSEGEEYYLRRRKAGMPKLQILWQMRQAPEARLFPNPLPGLNRALQLFRRRALLRGKRRAAKSVEAQVLREGEVAHVRQFFQYHDEEFVRVVYRFYLEREPDYHGIKHYAASLRQGVSRQRVLHDIARSAEARKVGKEAAGQASMFRALRVDSLPVLRTLLAIVRFNLRIRHHLQDIRAFQNHLYRISRQVDQQ